MQRARNVKRKLPFSDTAVSGGGAGMTTMVLVGLVAFNVGFLVGAFWVSAKNSDAREHERQDRMRWLRSQTVK
jgi:hypothetical protein